jgi:hypothetical protein
MKNCCFALLILFSLVARAQNDDSLLLQRAAFNVHKTEIKSTEVSATSGGYLALKRVSFPLAMVLYGFISLGNEGLQNVDKNVRDEILEHNENFHTSVDNYLQFVPAVSVYALNVSGLKGKHNLKERSILLGISTLIMAGTVYAFKHITHQLRPDSSDYHSFPSGHTATAFSGAEFMAQEYRGYTPFLRFSGYAMGTATGILRMYNNKHWLSNVIAGAGIGILSTKTGYWLFEKFKKKHSKSVSLL